MVLEDAGVALRPERLRDVLSLFLREDDAAKVVVHGQVVVEEASVLRQDIDGLPEDGPRLAIDRVAVGSSLDVWARLVDGAVYTTVNITSSIGERARTDVEARGVDGELSAMG